MRRAVHVLILFALTFAALSVTPVVTADESVPASSASPAASPTPTPTPTATATAVPSRPAGTTAPSVPSPRPSPPLADAEEVRLPDGTVLPPLPASVEPPSVHAEMLEAHGAGDFDFEPGAPPSVEPPAGLGASTVGAAEGDGGVVLASWSAPEASPAQTRAALPNGLYREVHGYLPYWMLDPAELQWMRYDLVSTIAYFGVPARSDGYLDKASSGWSGWTSAAMTDVINRAHSRGVKVVLTVTMMAWDGGTGQATLLTNPTYRARLVQEIVSAVGQRSADGVNLDFEPVRTAEREEYTAFVRELKAGLVRAGVGSYLTVCTTGGAAS